MSHKTLIVVPTYNEIENIEQVGGAFLKPVANSELLFVDDNSPDGTGDVADKMAAKDKRIHVLHRAGKEGLGKAYLAGFEWALARDYDVVVQMDADFSHDPKYLPQMVGALRSGCDVCVGSRYASGGGTKNWSLSRKLLSRGGGIYAKLVLGLPVSDPTAGFVAWRVPLLRSIELDAIETAGFGFQIELKYRAHKANATFGEVPIVFADRERGTSKMSGGIAVEALTLVWRLRLSK